ncbi:hypothetical protein FF011L_02980 [Roseimaritima multifibrata]|uniref:Glycosyl hydrolase family 32 N-terminal domain-containing protein n=1 Tax=Roseimaritima multifibrata TaxID=1930274 RepID=A0A517M9K0_9BACT|nr:hypothetical protein [Roseimaritima multifibrata]QDS91568.1 hypothetical protein FF011L_02980 [Roseimaritima multifibrata]
MNVMFYPFKILLTSALLTFLVTADLFSAEPVDVGNRLELFVDSHLIDSIDGDARQQLMKPEPKEVVFVTDQPWEGNTSGYYTLFQDGDLYRMIYRGWQHDEKMKAVHQEVTCYAESTDGIHWVKPKLGLFEWNGSKENNIVWLGPGRHNFTAFRDDNPATSKSSRYKAFGGIGELGGGLVPFASPDCVNWKMIQEKPVITHGAFDSQNLAFWDADRGEYRAYWRYFGDGVRSVRTATSQDFITWENEADLTYTEGTPNEHLYTNAIQKYFRAPHLFIGFPTRYEPKSQQVEPILMTSRDGQTFHRYAEPVIPRTAPKDRNRNRSNYMTWGMFQLPNQPKEISVYATENYYEPTPGRVRRFVYRVDGFVALRGGTDGGAVTTKPLRFTGERLLLNYVVRPGGTLTVEVLGESGEVTGKSKPLTGDAVDAPIAWEQAPDWTLGVAQLRFTMKNADVYSLRFQ